MSTCTLTWHHWPTTMPIPCERENVPCALLVVYFFCHWYLPANHVSVSLKFEMIISIANTIKLASADETQTAVWGHMISCIASMLISDGCSHHLDPRMNAPIRPDVLIASVKTRRCCHFDYHSNIAEAHGISPHSLLFRLCRWSYMENFVRIVMNIASIWIPAVMAMQLFLLRFPLEWTLFFFLPENQAERLYDDILLYFYVLWRP